MKDMSMETLVNRMAEALDERFAIWNMGQSLPDWYYYLGMTVMVEQSGFRWERFKSGKHIVYGGD